MSCVFPSKLKMADVSPVYKKGGRTDKGNYRPVSILPAVSKVYERLLFRQINDFIEPKLSQFQCGFRKGYSTQYCLVLLIETWERSVDSKGAAGALLADMSKAFDCLSHELLIAKLDAYGFSIDSLKFIHTYLTMRNQRVRVNSHYGSWSKILSGVPQGSILGPLLFNIYHAYLFIFIKDINIVNYADDNTPYVIGKDVDSVIKRLENESLKLFEWLRYNSLKANTKKSHLLLNSTDLGKAVSVGDNLIYNENVVELLGITIVFINMFLDYAKEQVKEYTHLLELLSTWV